MELAIEPQNYLIRSLDDPPQPGEPPEEERLPAGPPFDTDPFSLNLHYTLPSGQHVDAPDGIFVMTGPGIKHNTEIESIHVCDIVPTILYCMDPPIAQDFDGRISMDVFNKKFVSENHAGFIDSYEDSKLSTDQFSGDIQEYNQENALIMNRLKALGYIQ